MKFTAPNTLNRDSKILLIIAALVFTSFIIFIAHSEYKEYQGRQNYPLVKREFDQIQQPPDAAPTSENSGTSAYGNASAGNSYRTNLSYSDVKAHFDTELSKHGFELEKESESYGRKYVSYKKGELTVFITHMDVKYPDYTYHFSLSWNSY